MPKNVQKKRNVPIQPALSFSSPLNHHLLGIQRLNTLPDTRNAKRQLLVPFPGTHEPGLSDHLRKLLLRGELLDGFDKVLVAVPVPRDELSHQWDDGERVLLVDGLQGRRGDLGELETREDAAGLEHAVGGRESEGDARDVADAEGDGVEVDGVVGDAIEGFGVFDTERNAVRWQDQYGTVVSGGFPIACGICVERNGVRAREGGAWNIY